MISGIEMDTDALLEGRETSPYKELFGNGAVAGNGRPKGEQHLVNLNNMFKDESKEFRAKAKQRALRVLLHLYRDEFDTIAVQEASYMRKVGMDNVKEGKA